MPIRLYSIIFLALLILGQATFSSATDLENVSHEVVTIWSEGVRLAGDNYKPKGLAPDAKLPGKHYAIYRDEGYRKALKAAQDWFVKHLQGFGG